MAEAIDICDVLVVGGGINGCGIARDLAGRGWNVVLCEKDDLGAHTSSASTKLIHGGLRYLEHYEFSLVRKALKEREILLRSAPHIMWPLSFVMPHDPTMRPAWMIRSGLFLYDHLARREVLEPSRSIDLNQHPAGEPLRPNFHKGFVYSDGWVDDARLVILAALDARSRGATILTRTRCCSLERNAEEWLATLESGNGGRKRIRARALVNAAGPWAADLLESVSTQAGSKQLSARQLRLVKGSHIVVPRLYRHEYAYIFQSPDKRIIFAIPYERNFTLIGTTDVEWSQDAGAVRIDGDEIDYLCHEASRYLSHPVSPSDVIWSFSGVRPLLEDDSGDPSAVTRDYLLESESTAAPLLSVWGGKITTFRKLSEDAADAVGMQLGERRRAWTETAFLAGGDLCESVLAPAAADLPQLRFARFVKTLHDQFYELPVDMIHRMARLYGSRIYKVLEGATSPMSLGKEVAPGLFERELQYLRDEEWACTAEDVLWRRSKIGLILNPDEKRRIADWMGNFAPCEASRTSSHSGTRF